MVAERHRTRRFLLAREDLPVAAVPHFSFPFRFSGSDFAVVEQDSKKEIEDCTEAVLRTPVGSRLDQPELGIPDETFTQLGPNPSAAVYLDAVEQFEPRAHLLGEAEIEAVTKRVTIREDQA
jgi:phage baseplate assembly protein W